ncbi:MAG: hypothetical protein ACYTAF_08815 [Planctomycetota bacterium]|jgi:hypothetical protein
MRELKGDWRDLFNGFMLALDLRKMFLAFAGLLMTFAACGLFTLAVAKQCDSLNIYEGDPWFAPRELQRTLFSCWDIIYSGGPTGAYTPHWYVYVPYSVLLLVAFFAIWGTIGGAISRIAAYEIAKDGERIETTRALKFSANKFWSFFFAPVICVLGFLFFFLCNFAVGFIGKFVDFVYIGGPILAILLPLAILAGFIMILILVGSFAGAPLFVPAVAAEGTDSFDAVSRGFSYVYSRPWHYLWYQSVALVYGIVCIAFVYLFAVAMADMGLRAGCSGFDAVSLAAEEDDKSFDDVRNAAWTAFLSKQHANASYEWDPVTVALEPHPYGRTMYLANQIVQPDFEVGRDKDQLTFRWHMGAFVIVCLWLVVVLGHAYGYAISYFFSQQTMIYCLLRKKVDGIEMNEIFEEAEKEEIPPETVPPPSAEEKNPATARGTKRGTKRGSKRRPAQSSRRKKK